MNMKDLNTYLVERLNQYKRARDSSLNTYLSKKRTSYPNFKAEDEACILGHLQYLEGTISEIEQILKVMKE